MTTEKITPPSRKIRGVELYRSAVPPRIVVVLEDDVALVWKVIDVNAIISRIPLMPRDEREMRKQMRAAGARAQPLVTTADRARVEAGARGRT